MTAAHAGGSRPAGRAAAVAPLSRGLPGVRGRCARSSRRGRWASPRAPRFEIDFRLATKERQFVDALLMAAGVRLEALADDGLVVAGQPVKVTLIAANRGDRRRRGEARSASAASTAKPGPAASATGGAGRACTDARRRCRCRRRRA